MRRHTGDKLMMAVPRNLAMPHEMAVPHKQPGLLIASPDPSTKVGTLNRLLTSAAFVCALTGIAVGQGRSAPQTVPPSHEVQIPFAVQSANDRLEVVRYDGTDGLLQAGDIILWVATPDSDAEPIEVSTPAALEKEVLSKRDRNGSIALWVQRGNAKPDWVILPERAAKTSSPPTKLPLTVKTAAVGVEVVTYNGPGGLLRPGDIINWVATPDSEDTDVEVSSPETFQDTLRAKQDTKGQVALWVQRGTGDPAWVILPLGSLASSMSKSGAAESIVSGGPWNAGITTDGSDNKPSGNRWQKPFTVVDSPEGVNIQTHDIPELQTGDVIEWVWKEKSLDPPVTSKGQLETLIADRIDETGQVSVWVKRGSLHPGHEGEGWWVTFSPQLLKNFDESVEYHINHTNVSPHVRLIPENWGKGRAVVAIPEDHPDIKDFWKANGGGKYEYPEEYEIGRKLKTFGWKFVPSKSDRDAWFIQYDAMARFKDEPYLSEEEKREKGATRNKGKFFLRDTGGSCVCENYPIRDTRAWEADSFLHWVVTPSENDSSRCIVRNKATQKYMGFRDGKLQLLSEPVLLSEIEWQIGSSAKTRTPSPDILRKYESPVTEIEPGSIYRLAIRSIPSKPRWDWLSTRYHPQPGIDSPFDERSHWVFDQVGQTPYYYIMNLDSGMALTNSAPENTRTPSWGFDPAIDRARYVFKGPDPSVFPFSVESGQPGKPLKVVTSNDARFQPGDVIRYVRRPEEKNLNNRIHDRDERLRPGPSLPLLTTRDQLESVAISEKNSASLIDVYRERGGANGWIRVALLPHPNLSPYRQHWKVNADSGLLVITNRATGQALTSWSAVGLSRGAHDDQRGWRRNEWIAEKVGTADLVGVMKIDRIRCIVPSTGVDTNTKTLFKAIDFIVENGGPGGAAAKIGGYVKKAGGLAKKGVKAISRSGGKTMTKQVATTGGLKKELKDYLKKKTLKEAGLAAGNSLQGKDARHENPIQQLAAYLPPGPSLIPGAKDLPGKPFDEENSLTDDSFSEMLFSFAGGKSLPDKIFLKVNGIGVWPFKDQKLESVLPSDDSFDLANFEALWTSAYWEKFGASVFGTEKAGYFTRIKKRETVPVGIEFIFRKSKGAAIELMEWDIGKPSWDFTPGVFGSDDDSLGVIEVPTTDLGRREKVSEAILKHDKEQSFYTITFSVRPFLDPADKYAGKKAGEEKDGYCWCPASSFAMGTPADQQRPLPGGIRIMDNNGQVGFETSLTNDGQVTSNTGRMTFDNQNPVSVELTQGFWMGKHEVTRKQWTDVMGSLPPSIDRYWSSQDSRPVTNVSWTDAKLYCEKLNSRYRDAGDLPEGWRFDLPTEAQWEHACRAGTGTAYSFGDDYRSLEDHAWVTTNSRTAQQGPGSTFFQSQPQEVGTKLPNGWGLHDMHGNVSEYVRDAYAQKLPGGRDPHRVRKSEIPEVLFLRNLSVKPVFVKQRPIMKPLIIDERRYGPSETVTDRSIEWNQLGLEVTKYSGEPKLNKVLNEYLPGNAGAPFGRHYDLAAGDIIVGHVGMNGVTQATRSRDELVDVLYADWLEANRLNQAYTGTELQFETDPILIVLKISGAVFDGVEIATYDGTDGLFKPGDVITHLGSDVQWAVTNMAKVNQWAFDLKDKNDTVDFWTKRAGAEGEWKRVEVMPGKKRLPFTLKPRYAKRPEIQVRVPVPPLVPGVSRGGNCQSFEQCRSGYRMPEYYRPDPTDEHGTIQGNEFLGFRVALVRDE